MNCGGNFEVNAQAFAQFSSKPFAKAFRPSRSLVLSTQRVFHNRTQRCANRHHKKNKLVVECKGFDWHPCFFSMGWMGVGINDSCNAMRTTCAQDNLMPACGSPSICNLGVVRRRSFTAAAPEVAILAQSLSDGTLLTRVVCETAGCDFLFVVPLRLGSFDGAASPQCSKLVFSSQLLRFPSRSTSLILTVFRTTCRRISLLSLTTSLFLLPLPASSVMGTRLFWASLSLRLAVLLSAHALAV